ncbi:MAG: hypothetical protein D6712_20380 [Chloroflexi bacterium]|nr:MAG: hypothetical protein D6712_20380 [Chloroflexota bacterium]
MIIVRDTEDLAGDMASIAAMAAGLEPMETKSWIWADFVATGGAHKLLIATTRRGLTGPFQLEALRAQGLKIAAFGLPDLKSIVDFSIELDDIEQLLDVIARVYGQKVEVETLEI